MKRDPFSSPQLVRVFRAAEVIVLVLIAVLLIALSVLLLFSSGVELVTAAAHSQVATYAISVLDSVLLVMMTMEIVYTVSLQIQNRRLYAEPFLVIGAVAAIRRILVITANAAELTAQQTDLMRTTLLELGILAVIVFVMILSIYILRKANAIAPPEPSDASE